MKSFKVILVVFFVFALAVTVYAQGPGWGGYGPGYGMGPGMMGGYGGYGMGPGMMYGWGGYGPGYGRGPGWGYGQNEECQKFMDDTAKLRKELYNKRFEYFEAYRNPDTKSDTLAKLDREIRALQEKIYEKVPEGCGW